MTRFAALALGLLFTTGAYAQSDKCQDVDAMDKWLTEKFQEEISGAGISSFEDITPNSYTEVYASPAGATYTIIRVIGGMACIIDSGENWAQIPFVGPASPPKRPS